MSLWLSQETPQNDSIPPDHSQPSRHWWEAHPKKTLLIFLFSVICIMLVVTEKILALKANTHTSGIKRSIRLREYDPLLYRFQTYDDPQKKVFDSFTHKTYVLRVDHDGFIMPSKVHAHPDFVIVFLGASTTECTWVDEKNKFPYLVGRLMEKETGQKVNSYNASKAGNNTLHSINILYNKLISLKPNIVVMMHNVNDLNILLYENTYWNPNPYRSPIVVDKPSLIKQFKEIRDLLIPYTYAGMKDVIRLIRGNKEVDEFKKVRGKKINIDKSYLANEFRLNLETFIQICKIRGIVPVLMTQQNRIKTTPDPVILRQLNLFGEGKGMDYADYKEIYDLFNQTIRETGDRNGILVIDLAKKIPPEKEFLFDAIHLTDQGSKVAAQIIQEALRPIMAHPRKPHDR
jgi:lysophospholipase L1-like esterase